MHTCRDIETKVDMEIVIGVLVQKGLVIFFLKYSVGMAREWGWGVGEAQRGTG